MSGATEIESQTEKSHVEQDRGWEIAVAVFGCTLESWAGFVEGGSPRLSHPTNGTFPLNVFPAHPHDIITKTASSAGVTPRRAETASTRARTPGGTMDNNNPPNPNIHTIVKAQIVFLLSTLTEDNFDFNQNQIHTVRNPGSSSVILLLFESSSLTCFLRIRYHGPLCTIELFLHSSRNNTVLALIFILSGGS